MVDLLNACRHCGFDVREGQHGIIGPSDRHAYFSVRCSVPEGSTPLACVFTPAQEFKGIVDDMLAQIARRDVASGSAD